MRHAIAALFIVSLVLLSGCTVDRPYEPAQPFSGNEHQARPTPPPVAQPPVTPQVRVFHVGESATDGRIKVTVHNFQFVDKITQSSTVNVGGEDYTSSYDFPADPGNKFLIIDLSLENLQPDQTVTTSSFFFFSVHDEEGYSYDEDFKGSLLERAWKDGDLLPGMKRRGLIAYQVPVNIKGLKLLVKLDFAGSSAVFSLE